MKHGDGLKQLVAKNAELNMQLERHESLQSDLERNVAELANSYRHLSGNPFSLIKILIVFISIIERAEADTTAKDQAQEALSVIKNSNKTLQGELDNIKKEHEDRISKLTRDYESKLSAAQYSTHVCC